MYKPKLMSEKVGKFGKIFKSGLNKIRAYGHDNYSSSAMKEYSTSDMIVSLHSQETLNRLQFYNGLAIQTIDRSKCR